MDAAPPATVAVAAGDARDSPTFLSMKRLSRHRFSQQRLLTLALSRVPLVLLLETTGELALLAVVTVETSAPATPAIANE